MPMTESQLKKALKEELLAKVYFLYGEEPYLSAHYAAQIADKAVGGDELASFNLHKFDGQECTVDQIETAAEALPLMADSTCVVVCDYDVAGGGTAAQERLLALVSDPPESCVLVFWLNALTPELKKNAKWKAFVAAVEKSGQCVEFPRKTASEIVKLLCSGATRRGCSLKPENARLMVERSGEDLTLLLGELDKLSAIAGEGEITREIIESAGTKNLEASVFDLSRALLQNHYEKAYTIIHRLVSQKEEPVSILAVLSNAYADLYRAKVAAAAGRQAEAVADAFSYRGREFRLRNAARDCAHVPISVLRESLDVLAQADIRLKSSRTDKRVVLEETAARLILLAKTGGRE